MSEHETIVAEVSVTYIEGVQPPGTVSRGFETVIMENARRGYALRDWRYCSTPTMLFRRWHTEKRTL